MSADAIRRGQGAVMGALVGDSLGSFLEFQREVTPEKVEKALTMPGGGHWGVSPGQVTDDGEMTLCQMRALIACGPRFNENALAKAYGKWAASKPFDMGRATTSALGWIQSDKVTASAVRSKAAVNHRSQSNGALMRAVPLSLYVSLLPLNAAQTIVKADVSLTHPNANVVVCCTAYARALGHLVEHSGDVAGAIAAAMAAAEGNEAVTSWLAEATEGRNALAYGPEIGFAKYGFQHAFRQLSLQTPFLDAMRTTLSGGGDTDTNCCIVGGLLGALHGIDGIPANMTRLVTACDTAATITRRRPEFLRPGAGILDEIAALMIIRPPPSDAAAD